MTKRKICPSCGASYDAANLFCPHDSAPLRSADDPGELVGSLIAGRYLISGRIGIGGMGEVYRAQDVRLQRAVAIKVLHASLSSDLDALARFSREAANCSKINNQHVVHVGDFGETDEGLAYIAMELVPGRSLKALIDAEAPLEPDRVVRIVGQIANGLDAAHRLECPVVHRDLKPENVLVSQDQDSGELVKVADFGISKALRDDAQEVTKTGFVAGTFEYMSPEQVTGGSPDPRSDVYSLGLITFLMLTGKLPFPAQTPEHSMLLRLNEAPKSLAAIRPDMRWPQRTQHVIDKVLARDPANRYDSAGAFAKDLAQSLQPPQQDNPPVMGRSRRPTVPALVAVGMFALFGGAVVALVLTRRPPLDSGATRAPDSLISLAEPSGADTSAGTDTVAGTPPGAVRRAPESSARSQPEFSGSKPPRDTTVPGGEPIPSRPTVRAQSRPGSKPANPGRLPPANTQGGAQLRRFDVILHPGLLPDSALLVLDTLNAIRSHLGTVHDRVEVDLYRAEATALAGRPEDACAILDQARPQANDLQRRKIDLWVDQGVCGPQQSSVLPRRSRNVSAESLRRSLTISKG